MNLTLTRYGSIPKKGTFGELEIDGLKLYSIEREWINNEPGISCIPDGVYKLEPHSSRKFGETWALVNEAKGVYHYDHDNAIRFAILFHVANWQKDLQGCIGLGRNIGDSWNVSSSRHAMDYFLALLPKDEDHTLTIRWSCINHECR